MTLHHRDDWLEIHGGDARDVLATLPAESVHCVITSPPYWSLRDYGTPGQLGLEASPELFVAALVDVFREVRRVLRPDGTLWLNLGDSYNSVTRDWLALGLKPKDLVGIPWRVAFALQADGWYLRSDIVWSKPNPMPESVTDRPTKAHEYVFLLSKSARYYYDADAVREPNKPYDYNVSSNGGATKGAPPAPLSPQTLYGRRGRAEKAALYNPAGRNLRSVWTIATAPYPGAHFATFPPRLVEPCVKAGSPEGGTVLDPFAGTGTVGLVAQSLSRRAVLIDLNPEYLVQCLGRNRQVPLGLGS